MTESAQRLRAVRAFFGLTQVEMALMLNTPTGIYKWWEAGRSTPPGVLWVALACKIRLKEEISGGKCPVDI